MPLTRWLPWQRKVCWTQHTHAKMFPVKLLEKSQNLVVIAQTVTKLHNFKVEAGLKPPGLNRVKGPFHKFFTDLMSVLVVALCAYSLHKCILGERFLSCATLITALLFKMQIKLS